MSPYGVGWCLRCGHPYEKGDAAELVYRPTCECAGDPPIDRSGAAWKAYVPQGERPPLRGAGGGRMITPLITLENRRELCQARVTLNGRPAVIGGVRNPFATVAYLDGSGELEWSWDAVARIVASGGKFSS